jgi:prepilin-type N-terminal cleavage/methylation domain-containing protein
MKRWLDKRLALNRGFTIVEMLIVIAVIAVLAAIVLVGYGAVVNNAHDASVKSDLQKIDDAFKLFALDSEGIFPDSYAELAGLGIKIAPDSYDAETKANMYVCINPTASEYAVIAMSRSQKRFVVQSESGISEYTGSVVWDDVDGMWDETCESIDPTYQSANGITGMADGTWLSWTGADGAIASVSCPSEYIVVPGNTAFGTYDFCVMKYEAKNVGGVATSQASDTPWVSISQTSAISTAAAACSGCHLITDPEWITIAANIISVGSNWSGGTVGSGELYRGHADNSPSATIEASNDDGDGYINTGNVSGNQRRTFTLTNGEVIWDFSGNAQEWVNATIAGGAQPGLIGDASATTKQYNDVGLLWNGLPSIARPANVYSGAGSWSSTQGIGRLISNYNDLTARAYSRSGGYSYNSVAGVLHLNLTALPSDSSVDIGFRAAK